MKTTPHLMQKLAVIMLPCALMLSLESRAEVTLNAGLRFTHETNVNGSPDKPSKDNQLSDNSATLSASAVYYTPVDSARSAYFVGTVGAMASSYNRYDQLNNSAIYGVAGLFKQFAPGLTGQASLRLFDRQTRQDERDSDGWGSTVELSKHFSKALWLKGVLDYENSNANLSSFGYDANSIGLVAGYSITDGTLLTVGTNYTKRRYDTNVAFNTKSTVLYGDVTQRVAKNWYVTGSYAYQDNDSNIAGTGYTNQVISLAVNFSY